MGLNMKEKQAVTREYKPRYQKAAKEREKGSCAKSQGSSAAFRRFDTKGPP
jgi:hypothetical protein